MMDQLRQASNRDTVDLILRKFGKQKIGTGAYREIYDLGQQVLKLAKIKEGRYANDIEFAAANCLGSEYAVVVFELHPNALWLIAEKVAPATFDIIKSVLAPEWPGSRVDWFPELISANARNLDVPHKGKFQMGDTHDALFNKNAWYTNLIKLLVKCSVSPRDLGLRNWGTRDGKPVLLDLGGDGY